MGVGKHYLVDPGHFFIGQEPGQGAVGGFIGAAVYQRVAAAGQLYIDRVALADIKEVNVKPRGRGKERGVLGDGRVGNLYGGRGFYKLREGLRLCGGDKMEYG